MQMCKTSLSILLSVLKMKRSWLVAILLIFGAGISSASAQTITVSGVLSLPNADLAPTGGVQVSVQMYGSGDQTYFEDFPFTIPAGGNSVSYSLAVEHVPNVNWTIRVVCLCPNHHTEGYYSSSSPTGLTEISQDATILPGNTTYTGIDLEYLPGIRIEGTLSLPNGDVAPEGGLEVIIWSRRTDSQSRTYFSAGRGYIIPEGANSIDYIQSAAISSNQLLLYYSCRDCGDNNYLREGYYSSSGTVPYEADALRFDDSVGYSGINLQIIQGNSLSGVISLPNSDVADNGDIASWVVLGLYDVNEQFIASYSEYVTIPGGASSAAYQIDYPPVPPGGSYQLESYCNDNCGSYIQAPQFLQDDGSVDFVFNRVDETSLPAELNFELFEGRKLNGTLSLPGGAVASNGNIGSFVVVARYNEFGQFVDQFFQFVEILAGTSSVDYQVSYLPEIPGGSYLVRTLCTANCGDYVAANQYLQNDGSVSLQFNNTLSESDIPADLDIELILGQKLIGTVALPNSEVATGNIGVFTQIIAYDADDNFLSSGSATQSILDGSSSVDFEINYVPVPAGGSYLVSNSCQSNCGDYLQFVSTYLQPDGTTSSAGGFSSRVDQLPELVEFELISSVQLSGTISLPSGQIADSGDIGVSGFITTYDAQDNFLASFNFSDTITSGDSSTTYSVDYLPAPAGGSYTIASSCQSNCGNLVTSFVYLQEDGSSNFTDSRISASALPTSADIELIEGVSIDVRTVLPSGLTANVDLLNATTSVIVQAFDANDEPYGSGLANMSYNFGASISETSKVVVPEIGNDEYYKIIYFCDDEFSGDCGPLLDSLHGYSTSGIFTGIDDAEQLTELPSSVDLQLYRGTNATFESRRPASLPDLSTFVNIEATILAFDTNGVLLGRDMPFLSIGANQSSSLRNYGLLEVPAGGYYEIDFSCTDRFVEFGSSDCSSYASSDPSYSFVIQASSIPDPIPLQLVGLIEPDSFEVDNLPELANPITSRARQQHTIHEAGDVDWLKFSLTAPADVSIEALSQGSDGAARVSLFESDATTLIEDNDDILEDEEISNLQLSLINVPMLAAGDYFIRVQGFSDTSTSSGYTITYTGPEENFCFPIVAKNGAVAMVCL